MHYTLKFTPFLDPVSYMFTDIFACVYSCVVYTCSDKDLVNFYIHNIYIPIYALD